MIKMTNISISLREIIESERLDLDDFRRREFTLSQAFCLLWQNPKTGDVPGRMLDDILHITSVATVLLDLMALEKIAFQLEKESFITRAIFPTSREILVKVTDRNHTGTYLDDCLFNRILKCDIEDTVNEWMVNTMSLPSHVLSTTLNSLVKVGIFDKEQKKFGRRFPTINPGPQQELREEVHMIALQGQVPDSYMWSLLKLIRACDAFEMNSAPILAHQFDYKEYPRAIENIDKLLVVGTNKRKKQKYKRHTGSFDDVFDLNT